MTEQQTRRAAMLTKREDGFNYSAALARLVRSGGRIRRLFWSTPEYRAGTDRTEDADVYVAAITTRELELPAGAMIHDGPLFQLAFVVCYPSDVHPRRLSSVVLGWTPDNSEQLATDWIWESSRIYPEIVR